jgi:hypothetical protein
LAVQVRHVAITPVGEKEEESMTGTEKQIADANRKLEKFNAEFAEVKEEAMDDNDQDALKALDYLRKEIDSLETAGSISNLCVAIDIYDYAFDEEYRNDHGQFCIQNCKKF